MNIKPGLGATNTFTPDEIHEVDMDYRANWTEEDETRPSYIRNKGETPEPEPLPEGLMVFKSFSTGVLTVTIDEDDYKLEIDNTGETPALKWTKIV